MKKSNQKKQHLQVGTGEILRDGQRNWSDRKQQSLSIAGAYQRLESELNAYAAKIADCGTSLCFASCPQGHEKYLTGANFCRCRLCTMCQWRKSLAMYHQVLTLVHAHKKQYVSDIPLLLTLTVPNVSGAELGDCLSEMQAAFKKLMIRRPVKRAVRAWFRSLEVTYNRDRDDYHPHYHVLLMVPGNYFRRSRGLYIDQATWLTLWQEATHMASITQVDVRRVRKRKRGEVSGVVAEVAKYATKPSRYVTKRQDGSYSADHRVIDALHRALKGRRLVAFGGLFTALRRELALQDIEQADLVAITDDERHCVCSVCRSTLIDELYTWHAGLREYVC